MLDYCLLAAAAALAQAPAPDERTKPEPDQIIVTGERVRRSLKDTPSSVAVLTQHDIESASADRVEQVLALVPNVQLGNGSQGPTIRGQDTTGALQALPAFLGGNRPRTTLIVDGRRDTYNEFVFGTAPVWDVSRIEVFRSPQTTTQGQNSIAGAIFVYSNEPTFEPEYRTRLIGGNYRTGELSAVASGPISGDVAVRLAGDIRYSRTTSRIADRIEGGDPNHDAYGLVRGRILVKPRGDPDGRFEIIYNHARSQAPQVVGLTAPFRKRRDESGFYGTMRINVDALTATAHQPLSEKLAADLTLTAGDSDSRRLAFPGLGQTHTRGRDWSAEALFNLTPPGPLRAVGGVSRTHLYLRQFIDLSLLNGAIGRFHDAQDSTGVFGEASLTVVSGATITAGLRYQQDRQDRTGSLTTTLASVPLDFDKTFHAWLPKLSLAYDFSPAARVGLLVQRAYNPGGTTLRFDIARPDNFAAEKLWDYELFARARLATGLSGAANLFYYDMRNAQRLTAIEIPIGGGLGVGFADLFNAPRARSYGGEAELIWRPSDQFSAHGAIGLLRTKLVDAGPDYPEFSGNQFARSPHFTAAASAEWKATKRLKLTVQARHHSTYFADDMNSALVPIPPATLVDVRAELDLRRITAFAYARNLFDTFALIDRFSKEEATAEDPRMVGLGVEANF